MSNLVHIGNSEVSIKEYNGQRVVTFKDVDMVHERTEGTAKRNFNSNKDRFIEGEDYFIIPYSEFSTNFVQCNKGGNPNVPVVLLTEQGYLMLVKSFTDDLAWTVQRQLVNGYFKARNIIEEELSPTLQIVGQMFKAMAEKELADKERDRLIAENRTLADKAIESVENIKDAVKPVFDNWRPEINKKIKKIQNASQIDFQSLNAQMYAELERRAGCNLTVRLKNRRDAMREDGSFTKTQIEAVRKIDIIENNKTLREVFSKIVSEYEIKYCA